MLKTHISFSHYHPRPGERAIFHLAVLLTLDILFDLDRTLKLPRFDRAAKNELSEKCGWITPFAEWRVLTPHCNFWLEIAKALPPHHHDMAASLLSISYRTGGLSPCVIKIPPRTFAQCSDAGREEGLSHRVPVPVCSRSKAFPILCKLIL